MSAKPFISIVVPTMRIGGLDVLVSGLLRQAFKDFELVLVDGVKNSRPDVFSGRDIPFHVTHVEPIGNPFPVNSFCRYANTGIVHARGDVVLFLTDYTWLPPDGVGTHARFHEAAGGRGLMCPHEYTALPALSPDFHPYAGSTATRHPDGVSADAYAHDVFSGATSGFGWTIFARAFSQEDDPRTMPPDSMKGVDPKLHLPPGPVVPSMFHGKNESCPIDVVLSINGWDEEMDGCHGWQDLDISDRFTAKTGIQWTLDPSNIAHIVNPRHVFPNGNRLRPYQTNEAMWQAKKAAGFPVRPNSWDLAEARAKILAEGM